MFCTKCGAKLPPGAAGCPRCGVSSAALPNAGKRPARTIFILLVLACLLAVAAMVAWLEYGKPGSQSPGVDLADVAVRSVRPHSWHAAGAELPTTSLMYLPKADTGFVGNWGGHLRVDAAPGQMKYVTMAVVPVSYYFGERNGVVFIKTQVYGDPQWPVVKTGVKVINARSIEFRIDSVCKTCTPPARQQEVTKLTLINSKELAAKSYAYCYLNGDGHNELIYNGTLHLLTPDKLAEIDREVEMNGKPLARIDSKMSINN